MMATTDQLDALPDHNGQPRSIPVDFFASPPQEIGLLLSASSTLRKGSGLKPYIGRILLAIAVAAIFIVSANWVANLDNSNPSQNQTIREIGYGLAIAVVAIQLWTGRLIATCSFVGKRGVARYTVQWHPKAAPKADVLLFDQAAELLAKRTRVNVAGINTAASYDLSWNNSAGQRICHLRGDQNRITKAGDPGFFATAAEDAWSEFFLERAQKQLQAEGSIPFRIDKNRSVRVGPGFLEFHFGEEPVRLTTSEMASFSLKNGIFSFKHSDAKWFSRAGKYSFPYGTMANAKVFLLTLERLVALRSCLTCGYDLRATPDRCPECGTIPPNRN